MGGACPWHGGETRSRGAAGNVAEHRGVLYGIWGPSQYQGMIAGMVLAGQAAEFAGMAPANTLKVLGLDLFSAGTVNPPDGSCVVIEEDDTHDVEGDKGGAQIVYRRFLFQDARPLGAVLLGDTSSAGGFKSALDAGTVCADLLAARPTAREVAEHFAAGSAA